jgi:hypothetical protein
MDFADVKVVQRAFLFLSTYGITLSELIGVSHEDYTKLRVNLLLLANEWAAFSYSKHRMLPLLDMKDAASQALDFVFEISSDSKLLDLLSEQEFGSFSSMASICLGNIIDPGAILSHPDQTVSKVVLRHARSDTVASRQQRIMTEIGRLDESRCVSGTSGRVLDTSSSAMDCNLAKLSSEAPKARIKWQRGQFISKGATGSVTFFLCSYAVL